MNQTRMSDASLPFRSNESPVDHAIEQIRGQTRDVRFRANRFALLDGAFVATGIAFLGCASLILLAFRLGPKSFAVTAWVVLAACVGIVWRSVARARRSWMSAASAARAIDGRARLEERLSTLATATVASRTSRLWAFLLRENLRLMPVWEAQRFVPRKTPRSAWFFAIALVTFFVAWLQIPRTVSSAGANSPEEIAGLPSPAGDDSGNGGEERSQENSPPSFGWTDFPEAIRQAIVGKESSQYFAGHNPKKTAPVKDDKGGPAIVGSERMDNGGPVRSMPAGPNVPKPSGERGAGAKAAPAPDAKAAGASEAPPASQLARGDAPKMLPPAQSGKPQQGPTSKSSGKGGAGTSGGGGAGAGGDVDGLYGEKEGGGKHSGSFALDLDALRAGDPNATGDASDLDARPDGRLAPDQRLDDAIRRAQVPVEYEKVVQRIFNRTSEEDSPP